MRVALDLICLVPQCNLDDSADEHDMVHFGLEVVVDYGVDANTEPQSAINEVEPTFLNPAVLERQLGMRTVATESQSSLQSGAVHEGAEGCNRVCRAE